MDTTLVAIVMAASPGMLTAHPQALAITAALLLLIEQILPHLPIKANSTVQIIINVFKAILGKKG